MSTKENLNTWNSEKVKSQLDLSFDNNSEIELLNILKNNSFLFYELFSRKYGIQPIFHEVPFGGNFRCDFAWLNDNSDGPEWVLVEIEKPRIKLFTQKREPSQELNHSIEQVKSWRRYFNENPNEKRRIFGAAARFRYILVAGDINEWKSESASKWRIDNNRETNIEIRSSNIFYKAIKVFSDKPNELWSFAENPVSLKPSELADYWRNYDYISYWRRLLD